MKEVSVAKEIALQVYKRFFLKKRKSHCIKFLLPINCYKVTFDVVGAVI